MKILCLGIVLAMVACVEPKVEAERAQDSAESFAQEMLSVGDVPIPNAVYESAIEKAKAEINVDNAEQRLREIERQIDEESRGTL